MVENVPLIWHQPGGYGLDLPGPDYEFELALGDDSSIWSWRMCEPDVCWDALRVYMGDIPMSIGLKRLEVRLPDHVDMGTEGLTGMEFLEKNPYPDLDWDSVLDSEGNIPLGANLPPDRGVVPLRCYDRHRNHPDNDVFCRIYPSQGNSENIHMLAAMNQSLADTAG